MDSVLTNSPLSRYKSTVAVFLVIVAAAMYVLRPTSTDPGVWMGHFTSLHSRVKNVIENASAAIFDFVLRSHNLSSNGNYTTDFIVAPPEGRAVNKTGRYVSMCKRNFDSRRTGNQLFNLAAMLHVARLTGRRVAMVRRHLYGWLDRWFEVPVTRVDRVDKELCPCVAVHQATKFPYPTDILALSKRTGITRKSLLVCGWFQSWKYTVGIESALRYHLRLLPNISAAVDSYLRRIKPSAWKEKSFSRIGIHVRAGDVMRRDKYRHGFTVPQRPYFEKAMHWFVNQQRRQRKGQSVHMQFIVATNSPEWVKTAINFTSIAYQLSRTASSVVVDVTHSEGHSAGFDLALLSVCDGLIISTGSYGWWSAWLANKTTIYYSNWPRAGSPLAKRFARHDYFPPNWIPLNSPEFHWRN